MVRSLVDRKLWSQLALTTVLMAAVAFVAFRLLRGPVGATTPYGGDLEARAVPGLPVGDRAHWIGQVPRDARPGGVWLVEAWHPE